MTDTTESNDQNLRIYYRDGETTLPDGETVKPGGFYMKDDDGSVVFQLFSQTNNAYGLVEGELNDNMVTVQMCRDADKEDGYAMAGAESYKCLQGEECEQGGRISNKITKRAIVESFMISISPTPSGLSAIQPERGFIVNEGQHDDEFCIYTVHSEQSQSEAKHVNNTPCIDEQHRHWTKTKIKGNVYVQKNGTVYSGEIVETSPIVIQLLEPDPDPHSDKPEEGILGGGHRIFMLDPVDDEEPVRCCDE